jgi:hypothetical protein
MQQFLEMEQVYSEDYMLEIRVRVSSCNFFFDVSCYTQQERIKEFSLNLEDFAETLNPFVWSMGTLDFSCFEIKICPHDRLGHIRFEIRMSDIKNPDGVGNINSNCCLIFDLGQIESLSGKVLKLISETNTVIRIESEI